MEDTLDTTKNEKLATIFSKLEKPTTSDWMLGHDYSFTKVSISTSVPEAYLLKHVLVDSLSFPCDYMPMEKVLWEICFIINGILCKVVSHKFGHRLYIGSADEDTVSKTTDYLVGIFNSATAFLSTLLKDYADIEIKKGNVSIDNQYSSLRATYDYFRDEAKKKRAEKVEITPKESANQLLPGWNAEMEKLRHASYLDQGAYFAFFGLLEHVLVLFLAFNDFDPKTEHLKEFIFRPWADKYKRAFNLRSDKEADRHYQLLIAISRKYRNPQAHGMFNKEGRSMAFFLEGTGLLSAHFSNEESNIPQWVRGDGKELEELGDFLLWLEGHTTYKVPMQIIKGGLRIHFSEEGRQIYKDLMNDGDASEFVEHENLIADDHGNMDW